MEFKHMFVESLSAKTRVRETFLPFALPWISDQEINEVADTLRSGWLTTGPKTKLFETEFAQYIGVKHAIAVNSCTAGLHLALLTSGITQGDEVIVPTITFAATANVVVHCGAKPVLADVGDDLNIKISEIPRLITPKTKAIIPVHFAGQPAPLTEILAIAKKNNLIVIEDAAHAVGSSYRGKKIGTISPITVFSFYPTKNMTTSEGGMVCTNNDEIAEKIRILSLHGICLCQNGRQVSKDAWKRYTNEGSWYYEIHYPGYKYNMTDIQAAIGLCQLAKLDQFLALRRRYADLYTDALRFIPEISLPPVDPDSLHSWHLYVILLNLEKLTINRAQFIEALRYENIGTSVHFIPLHLHPYYQNTFGYRAGCFPNAEWLYQRIISLPLYPKMTQNDINDTIQAIKNIIKRMRK
jgi:dTDP-4-amino-4,6-dideoxygalactose transaminase